MKAASTIRNAVLVVGACILVLAVSLRYQKYQSMIQQAEMMTLESLKTVVWGVAQVIDGEEHQKLQESYLGKDDITALWENSLYDNIHFQLERAQKQLGFETPLYTYTTTGDAKAIEFIVTSADTPYFRHQMTSAPTEQIASFGNYNTLPKYTDSHGTWLSACAPIYNEDAEVVAMVQADRRFDFFLQRAEKQAYKGLWWNILLILGLIATVWKYMSILVIKEERARKELQSIAEEKSLLLERLMLREKELEKQKELLISKNQYLEDFANIASHDLKSPLRGIANFAGLLSRRLGPQVESSITEYIDFIKSNASRALKLVDGILSYSKLETDSNKDERCNLNKIVCDSIENLQAAIDDVNAEVSVKNELPLATCDPVIITQLFQNLIGNGIKYNDSENPTVLISSAISEGHQLVFAIEDNGIGIADEYKDSIFEMFSRLHHGEEYDGSGIGLAFCLRIINSYGGDIWLDSEEGAGSTFYFTLPNAFAPAEYLQQEVSSI